MRRVVITGLGAVTPLGNDLPTTWRALLAGKSGIGLITRFDASGLPIRIAGEVKNFALDPAIDAREARRMALNVRYALNAVLEAARAAGCAVKAKTAVANVKPKCVRAITKPPRPGLRR